MHPKTVGQYTGLKDKNDKDIYEGDILIFHAVTSRTLYRGYCLEPYKKGQKFIVKNLPTGWNLTDIEHKDSEIPSQACHVNNDEFWNHQKSFEIIGNIHENPELLEQWKHYQTTTADALMTPAN